MVWLVLGVIAVVFLALKRRSSIIEVRSDVPQGPGAPPPTAGGPNMDEVRRLAAGGQTVEAIKLFRSTTGFGLAQAKDAIDMLMRAPGANVKTTFTVSTGSKTINIDPQTFERVKGLISSGQIMEAVRLVRDLTGQDHAAAHASVRQLLGGAAPAAPAAPNPDADARVRALIQQDQMIEAIKLFRETYGGDLKTAKEALERIKQGL